MTHSYQITGMTCDNCVARVKNELLKIGDVVSADVQLQSPQAVITMQKHLPLEFLQSVLSKAGSFTITGEQGIHQPAAAGLDYGSSWWQTYKPVILVGAFITGVTLLLEAGAGGFVWQRWMNHFMAGFFLVFSFFKLLDLKQFAVNYASYDVVARRWQGWGYAYAFIELGLGLAFLLQIQPLLINSITFAVMSVSMIGVLQSVLNRRKIRCACLGAVFNLPMSTITILEDGLMIAMSATMIITML